METRFPNESMEYRAARQALLEEEIALNERVKKVAELRRTLPTGGALKEDYVFASANDGTLGDEMRFSGLFGERKSLLLYSYMFGDSWDNPCPLCTSLIDGMDRASVSVVPHAGFAIVAKTCAGRLNEWAKSRGWTSITLLSAKDNTYMADYLSQKGDDESTLMTMMNVFQKNGDAIHHFWGSEMRGNHVDLIWPYWNLMDMTPQGRPDSSIPELGFTSQYLIDNYLS